MRLCLLLSLVLCVSPACSSETSAHQFSSDIEECKSNLRSIYTGLDGYRRERGEWPEKTGVAFLAELIASGYWENTEANARLLTCPGVDVSQLGIAGRAPETWFNDLSTVNGESSSYAGRDAVKYRLPSTAGPGDSLVACDNQHGSNHDNVTNVLMSDGSILSLELATEIELGNVPEGTTELVIGPTSTIEELKPLSLD